MGSNDFKWYKLLQGEGTYKGYNKYLQVYLLLQCRSCVSCAGTAMSFITTLVSSYFPRINLALQTYIYIVRR